MISEARQRFEPRFFDSRPYLILRRGRGCLEYRWHQCAVCFERNGSSRGAFVAREGNTFAIVHHQTKRGVKVILRNESFAALIVIVEDPEPLVASLALPEGH